jgi:hypothetical protein
MDSTKYIGMDVHKEAISIAALNSSGKLVITGNQHLSANTPKGGRLMQVDQVAVSSHNGTSGE